MEKKQAIGIISACVLFAGVFAPTIALGLPINAKFIPFPVHITVSYFQYSSTLGVGEWMIVVGLAAIALLLALTKIYLGLLFTSVLSLGTLVFTVIDLQNKAELLLTFFPQPIALLIAQVAEIASTFFIQFQWGAILLLSGPVLMFAASLMPQNRRTNYQRGLEHLAQAVVVCSRCQTANSAAHTFCGRCGSKILPAPTAYPARSAPHSGAPLLPDPTHRLPPHG